MRKHSAKKLTLAKETLRTLDERALGNAAAGNKGETHGCTAWSLTYCENSCPESCG